jgi:hypothetical protein
MAQLVTGTFNDSDDADRAIRELTAIGYKQGDISVMMSAQTHKRILSGANADDFGQRAVTGASVGAIAGGALAGAAAGAALSSGAIVAGPLAAAAAVAAGAAGGAIIGALAAAGIPEEQHGAIKSAIDAGDIVVAVESDDAHLVQVRTILGSPG